MSFNKVIILGNLTREPEIKFTTAGTKVCQIGVALSETYRDRQTNEKRETVCYVDVTVWDKGADWAEKWLKKGKEILVEGKLKLDQWDDKQTGQKRQRLVVTAEKLTATGGTWAEKGERPPPSEEGRPSETRTPASSYQRQQSAPPPRRREPAPEPDLDAEPDDIPFN